MTNNSAHQSDLELQTVTPFSLRKIPARIFQALGWFALNTVLGIMYSLLISFYSPEPFLRVFLTAQITTHALCILVEVTLFTAGPSLFRTGERKKQPVRYFLLATLCAVLAAIAGVFVGGAVHEALLGFDPYVNNRFFNVIFGSIIIAIGVTSLERLIRSLNERRIEALQALQEARLSVLQERMRPHFLFNTLNTIHSLLPGDPRAADSALMQLAESYRFLLNSAEKQRIPFQEEWDFCSDYIDLMKLRFGDRLNVQMEKIGGFHNN